jgi:hypothetical protein
MEVSAFAQGNGIPDSIKDYRLNIKDPVWIWKMERKLFYACKL